MLVSEDKFIIYIKQMYVTNNQIFFREYLHRRNYTERIRDMYDIISTYKNNFSGTLSNKFSTVASFVEHNTFNEISGKIFHFNPFTTNALDNSINYFLNLIGPHSICIKGILSVGCFVLISNYFIPFISKKFKNLKGIMSKFLEKLLQHFV